MDDTIARFLAAGAYHSMDEWMADSDYLQVDIEGETVWVDLDDNRVDPEGCILGAIEASGFEQKGACILTSENMDAEDDCTTHDHESV